MLARFVSLQQWTKVLSLKELFSTVSVQESHFESRDFSMSQQHLMLAGAHHFVATQVTQCVAVLFCLVLLNL